MIHLNSAYQNQKLSLMYCFAPAGTSTQLVKIVRIVRDTVNMQVYLDMYYQHTANNPFYISIIDGILGGGHWEVLDKFIPVSETEDGIEVMDSLYLGYDFNIGRDVIDCGDNISRIQFSYSKPGLSESELPNGWLAAWNHTELRAIHWNTLKTIMKLGNVENTTDGEKDVNSARFLKGWTDTRNVATVPNDYNGSFKIMGIKTNGANNVTGHTLDGSMYATLLGIRGWNDNSGGRAHEFALTLKGAIYHRVGETTTWEAWRKIAHTSDIPTALSSFTNDLTKVKLVPSPGSWIQGMQVNNAAVAIRDKATTNSYYPAMTMQLKDGHVGTIGMCSNNFGLWGYLAGRTANGSDAAFYFDFGQKMWCVGPALKGDLKGNADTATALASNAGSATQPVYFSGGKPVACSYTLGKSVPSDAKFTDTTYPIEVTASSAAACKSAATIGYSKSLSGVFSSNNGAVYSQRYSDKWQAYIYQDYRTGHLAVRGNNNGTMSSYNWIPWAKSAQSGTGTTKYLREDGTWSVPPDTNTWRGIQNNLTSTSTSDSLSAAQGRALANGSARDSTKLPLAGGSMTGAINMNGHDINLASDAYFFCWSKYIPWNNKS